MSGEALTRVSKPVAVVTGGSSGIGLAIARRFARDGYQVVVIGRRAGPLEAVARELGSSVATERGDVSVRRDVERIAGAIQARCRQVDVLVNNAGILETVPIGTPLEQAEAIFDRVLGASLKGSFLMSHALAPLLRSPGGRIINMGSIVAHSGASVPGYTAYTAAKAGLHGLTLALARELAPRGINVCTVAPGFTLDTGQTSGWTEERVGKILSQIPLGRPGRADDIANAVAWLASSEGSYITGMTLPVNGGWRFYQ